MCNSTKWYVSVFAISLLNILCLILSIYGLLERLERFDFIFSWLVKLRLTQVRIILSSCALPAVVLEVVCKVMNSFLTFF